MATAELIVEREEPVAQVWSLPSRIPELDGVRGIAILLVMICHSAISLPSPGMRAALDEAKMGVDLFFVLSGFLITGILLDMQRDPRALRSFYIRRGLRIWPLYFGFLLAAFTIGSVMNRAHVMPWAYLLFVQNFVYIVHTGPLLDPTWSLAVEEQFYVVWPWIALRAGAKWVLRICVGVFILALVIRCTTNQGPSYMYVNTFCRMDGIALGGAIAAWVRTANFRERQLMRFADAAMLIGLAGMALCYAAAGAFVYATQFRYSFTALAFGGLLARALYLQSTNAMTARVLRSSWLTGLGRISFALYMFNLPMYTLMHSHLADHLFRHVPSTLTVASRIVLGNVLVLVAAAMSWKFFEGPILKLKSRLAPRELNAVT